MPKTPAQLQREIDEALARQPAGRPPSLSDNPAKWAAMTADWPAKRHRTKKTSHFKKYELHWYPIDQDTWQMWATLGDEVVASLFYGKNSPSDTTLEGAIEVQPAHRRKGLATAMYSWAEVLSGMPMAPAAQHTRDAAAFWTSYGRK
jgi:hypothetical protein